jgi:hypothetical protein
LDAFEARVFSAYLAGFQKPGAIIRQFDITPTDEYYPIMLKKVTKLLDGGPFMTRVRKAQEDVVGSTLTRYRDDAAKYKFEMDRVAFGSNKEENRMAAAKDGLNRAGTAPAQKLIHFAPDDYRKALDADLGPGDEHEGHLAPIPLLTEEEKSGERDQAAAS